MKLLVLLLVCLATTLGATQASLALWRTTPTRLGQSFFVSLEGIDSLIWASTGSRLFASDSRSVLSWSHTGKKRELVKIGKGMLSHFAVSHNSGLMAYVISSGLGRHNLVVRNIATDEIVSKRKFLSPILTSAFSADDTKIAVGGNCDSVLLLDVLTGKLVKELKGQQGAVSSIMFSNDGKYVVGGDEKGIVYVWSSSKGELLKSHRFQNGVIQSIVHSDDNDYVISCSSDSAFLFNYITGKIKTEISNLPNGITGLAVHAKKHLVAIIGFSRQILIFDLHSGKLRKTLTSSTIPHAVAWSPNGRYLVWGRKSLEMFDWAEQISVSSSVGHSERVTFVAFDSDESRIVSCGEDQSICLWAVAKGTVLKEIDVCVRPLSGRVVSDLYVDRRVVIWGDVSGYRVNLWNLKLREPHALVTYPYLGGSVNCLKFDSNTDTLAIGRNHGKIEIWHIPSNKRIKTLLHGSNNVTGVSFSEDGKLMASISDDGSLVIWNTVLATVKRRIDYAGSLRSTQRALEAVSLSGDGQLIGVRRGDNSVEIWHAASGKLLWTRQFQHTSLYSNEFKGLPCIEFCPDGKTVAVAGGDKKIRLCNVKNGKQTTVLEGPEAGICAVAFSSDGRSIVAGSADTSIYVWHRQ